MTDVRISELGRTTTLENADLVPLSKSMGGGNWESKAISGVNLRHALSASRTLTVATDGAVDANNIGDAIALAVALTPTEMNPVVIQVYPGSYVEDNPLTIPQWVNIYSEGGQFSSGVVAQNDGVIFNSEGNSILDGFSIIGLPAYNNTAFKSSTSVTGVIQNCVIINCAIGILSDDGSVVSNFCTGLSFQKTIDKFLSAINEGFISATSNTATGIMTRPNYAYYSCGSDSELYLFSCIANNCVNGMFANNNGYIDSFSNHYEDCDNSLHIGSSGSSHIKAMGIVIEDSIVNDLFIESATSILAYMGHVDSSKFSIVSGAIVDIVADDENTNGGLVTGNASLQGKVGIGTPGAITLGKDMQLNVGEGNAFINDEQGNPIVEYWAYNASSPSGGKFSRYANNAGTQLTESGDALYVGCKFSFPSIRVNITTAMSTANYLTIEYWNGTTWVDLDNGLPSLGGGGVAGYRRSDFARRKNLIFRNIEVQFVEFSSQLFSNGDWIADRNVLDEIPDWDAGENFFAIRFRNNGALTTGMQFTDGRVKPHTFMVSTSGYKANFGLYRTAESLYIDAMTFTPDPVNPPSYVSLQISPNIAYDRQPSFKKANAISQISTAFIIPSDLDTSSPLECYVDGIATAASAGDIYSTIYVARIDSQNPPSTLPITDIEVGPQVTTVPETLNAFTTVYQPMDVSSFNEGDLLLISFARDTTQIEDTYAGDMVVGDMTFKYKSKFV